MTDINPQSLAAAMAGLNRPRSNYDFRRRAAYAQMQAGMDTSPVEHWTQGASRLASALVGGWSASKADADEKAADAKEIAALGDQLKGTTYESLAQAMAGLRAETARPILAAALGRKLSDDAATRSAESFVGAWGGPGSVSGPTQAGTPMPNGYQGALGGYESDNNPNAVNPQSGAHGEFQFLAPAAADVRTARPDLNLPADHRQWSPDQQRTAETVFRQLNGQRLQSNGIPPTPANLYLAHRAGARGAAAILQASPDTPLSTIVPVQWLQQNPDMRTTAGQFIAMANQRFGGQQQGPSVQTAQISGPPGQGMPQAPGNTRFNGPQVVQGDSVPQYATGDGQPPRPSAAGISGVPAIGAPPDVPMPQPSQESIQRYGRMVQARQITPEQANAGIRQEVMQEWQIRRQQALETWRANNQSARDDRRDQMAADRDVAKQQGEVRTQAQIAVIRDRVGEYEKTMRPRGLGAVQEITAIHQARQLLDDGALTGPGASWQTAAGKLGEFFGINLDSVTNTQALQGVLAERVLSAVKQLGANPSNADRDYLEKAKGGSIAFTEPALRRILDIGEKVARNAIHQHDSEAGRIRKLPGVSELGTDIFTIGNAPTYDAWRQANPMRPPAQSGAPQGASQFSPQMQGNGYASHPNPNAPTNASGGNLPVVNSPEEARRLPSGTRFRTPDGREKVVP